MSERTLQERLRSEAGTLGDAAAAALDDRDARIAEMEAEVARLIRAAAKMRGGLREILRTASNAPFPDWPEPTTTLEKIERIADAALDG